MDVLVTGYPSIDHIAKVSHSPAVGETARLFTVPDQVTYGGCGTNTGVALAKMEFRVGVAVVLGDDAYGVDYLAHLNALGMDTANAITLSGELTSQSYLFLNPEGQYQNFFLPGAADAWGGKLTLHGLEAYRFALVTVGQFAYNRQFVRLVRAAGVPLVWVLKSDVFAYPPDMVQEFWAASAYILMNHLEAEYVRHALQLDSVDQLLNDTTRALVITRGAEGAQVYTVDGVTMIPAVSPVKVVDPTGAGDGFTAGFLGGLLSGESPQTSAQLGAVVASYVIEAVGCQTNLPTWALVMARYRDHY
jgi:adenosine kinase